MPSLPKVAQVYFTRNDQNYPDDAWILPYSPFEFLGCVPKSIIWRIKFKSPLTWVNITMSKLADLGPTYPSDKSIRPAIRLQYYYRPWKNSYLAWEVCIILNLFYVDDNWCYLTIPLAIWRANDANSLAFRAVWISSFTLVAISTFWATLNKEMRRINECFFFNTCHHISSRATCPLKAQFLNCFSRLKGQSRLKINLKNRLFVI